MLRATGLRSGCVILAVLLATCAAAEQVTFRYAPIDPAEVTSVSLRGSFNDWGETAMHPGDDGTWSVIIDLPPGDYEYKYFINETWPGDMASSDSGRPLDPYADAYAPDGFGGRNAVRYVGLVPPQESATPPLHEYVFEEEKLSADRSRILIGYDQTQHATVAAASMRLMYDVHRLAAARGFRYVVIGEQRSESSEKYSIELEFLNEAPPGYEVIDLMNPGPERDLDPQKTLYDAVQYVSFWDAQMNGRRSSHDGARATAGVMGYRITDEEVIFELDVADYEGVTRHGDGVWFGLNDVDIEMVAVAGDFNEWSADAWAMSEAGVGVYELRRPIDVFSARPSWEFKFVLNGRYWVEPPAGASNRVSAGSNGPVNLELSIR